MNTASRFHSLQIGFHRREVTAGRAVLILKDLEAEVKFKS